MKVLVTGAAGFIGAALTDILASKGHEIVGIDNLNGYYDVSLKKRRLARLGLDIGLERSCRSNIYPGLRFVRMSIEDEMSMDSLFSQEHFDKVVNLAAQPGVRYSIESPVSYVRSNVAGFFTVLECCRNYGVKHLVFASSSSVYGMSDVYPYNETERIDRPLSMYAATKASDEMFASVYSRLYGLPVTGLRYFTVYGPWGRPDMAPMLYANAIYDGKPINVFNNGDMVRDFTYISDIVDATEAVLGRTPSSVDSPDGIPYVIYNAGCSSPVQLMDFIREMEDAIGIKAKLNMMPMQPGDVYKTYADISRLHADTGFMPKVKLKEGIRNFVQWFLDEKVKGHIK